MRFPNIPNSLYLVSSFGETGYQYNAQALDTLKGPFLTRTGHETKCYILQCTKFSEPYMGTQLVWCCCKNLYKPKNWHCNFNLHRKIFNSPSIHTGKMDIRVDSQNRNIQKKFDFPFVLIENVHGTNYDKIRYRSWDMFIFL